jgi:hypothetical protein
LGLKFNQKIGLLAVSKNRQGYMGKALGACNLSYGSRILS